MQVIEHMGLRTWSTLSRASHVLDCVLLLGLRRLKRSLQIGFPVLRRKL